jgi:hypothetical protein
MQLVKVANIGSQYSRWVEKFNIYGIPYNKHGQNNSPPLQQGEIYKVIDVFKHDIFTNTTVYVIEDLQTKHRYLIGKCGLEEANPIEYVISIITQELI